MAIDGAAIHKNAVEKGFWDHYILEVNGPLSEEARFNFIAKQCMMIVSEVSELMEAVRKDKGASEIEAEFADVAIRLYDLWEAMRRSGYISGTLDEAVEAKTQFNSDRPRMHGVLG